MHDEPPVQAPIALIEWLVAVILLLVFTELLMGFPSSLVHAQTAYKIKQSYLASISAQNLAVPADPNSLRIKTGCLSNKPLWLKVKTVSGETYSYDFTAPTGDFWWTTKWNFKLSHVSPAYTNLPTAPVAPPLPPPLSVTITNSTEPIFIPLNDLVPLAFPEP